MSGAAVVVALALILGSCADAASRTASAGIVRIAGPIEPVGRVEPVRKDQLPQLERDAGVSARLSDGSVAWFFGDTGTRYSTGQLRYFVIGSAAWASAADPLRTQDFVAGDRPLPLVPAGASRFDCPSNQPTPGYWPLSAVVVPSRGVDRVFVWLGNICLGQGQVADRGVSVAVWEYQPGSGAGGRPLVLQSISGRLFDSAVLGDAALLSRNGLVYVYGCGGSSSDPIRRRSRPCHVARVRVGDVGQPGRYRWWSGSRWGNRADSTPLELSKGQKGPNSPQGPFSVTWNRSLRRFLMVYSPWPGFVPFGAVRSSVRPEGPWGRLTQFDLPDCDDGLTNPGRACYGVNAQPWADIGDSIGIGYSDRSAEVSVEQGAFLVARLRLSIDKE